MTLRQGSMLPRRLSAESATGGHADHPALHTAVTDITLVDNLSDTYHTALEDHVNRTAEDHDTEVKSPGKQPQISVFLTVFLLIMVTGASVFPKFFQKTSHLIFLYS